MNRIIAGISGAGALLVGGMALAIALGPKGDASGWVLALVFAGVAAVLARSAWKDWNGSGRLTPGLPPRTAGPSRAAAPTARPSADGIPLEVQIRTLADAGLALAPGRTIAELLESWAREDYEADPYGLLLFMYGSEVEAEPRGRIFCERGWDFDMECLAEAGDYARAFEQIVRITGQPRLVTGLSDDFRLDATTVEIRYAIAGRPQVLTARVDNDWADPAAVADFVREVESEIGDGRRFWAADNGQSSVLFFLTGSEAEAINGLRDGVLERYVVS